MATMLTAALTHLKCSARACCLAVARTASVTAFISPFFVSSRAALAWASAVTRMVSVAWRAASAI
jgi:hypothetical protein